MSASFRTATNSTTGDRLEVGRRGEHLALVISGRRDVVNIVLTPADAAALAREIVDPVRERERHETMLERNRRALREEIARGRAEAERRAQRAALEADAWELYKTGNPGTRKANLDTLRPQIADKYRDLARKARELHEARK